MANFSLSWSSLLSNGRDLYANHEVVIATWPNHLSCFSLDSGAPLLLLPVTRWSEHRVSFLGDVPILLRRPSFGNFEIVPLLLGRDASHWSLEVPESEDVATMRGELVLASSPWAIQLSRVSSSRALQTLWEDRTTSKARQLFISPDGGLVGAVLQGDSCVWSASRSELVWRGAETLCCLGPWGWLASSGSETILFDPMGYPIKRFPSQLQIMAQSERYLVFVREARGLRLDLQTAELRTISVESPSAAALKDDLLYVGGQSTIRVYDDDLSLRFDVTPAEWSAARLFPEGIRGLLPLRGRLLALTAKQLICLR